MHIPRIVVVLVALLSSTSCAPLHESDPGASSAIEPGAAIPDSVWVSVDRPTVVAFLPPTAQEQMDAGGDMATVLDDFVWHLAEATDSLRHLGFAVEARLADTLWLRSQGQRWSFVPNADDSSVGFYLTRPDAVAVIRYGVLGWPELIQLGREFLALPEE